MQKILKNEKGSISLFILLAALFFLVVVTGVGVSLKNKEVEIDAHFEKTKASYEKDVGNEEQVYNNTKEYTVNFNANLFDAPEDIENDNGLQISYDKSTSVLTINGTSTSTLTKTSIYLAKDYNFVENDEYKTKLEHISGSCSGSSILGLITDVRKTSGASITNRNNNRANIIPFESNDIPILKINSSSATEGGALEFWIWFNTGKNNFTFDNYKVKVNFTKIENKKVKYNSVYGELPIPEKKNYEFGGWYTGENGTGTRIESTSNVQITNDITLYAKWIEST